jgi:YegS/Rv2252/BmrU family lipid kinase
MNGQKRTLIIINNAAARSLRAWPSLKALLTQHGLSFDAYETRHAGDATTQTRSALRAGYDLIAVVGGDGTLSEAAAGFFTERASKSEDALSLPSPINQRAALAILPTGTGNDFARGLLLGRREAVEQWAMRLVSYRPGDGAARTSRTVDVICGQMEEGTHRFICLNAATIGIGAEVASRVAAQRGFTLRLPGEARFVKASLGALMGWRERRAVVSIEGDAQGVIECQSNLIAVANGAYAGGGMMFAPDARVDDGKMDVVLASDGLTRAMIMRELPRIRRGTHLLNPKVRVIQATSLHISTPEDKLLVEADGNVRGHTPVHFRIMPAALRVVV